VAAWAEWAAWTSKEVLPLSAQPVWLIGALDQHNESRGEQSLRLFLFNGLIGQRTMLLLPDQAARSRFTSTPQTNMMIDKAKLAVVRSMRNAI
jgi:hypothetical protein